MFITNTASTSTSTSTSSSSLGWNDLTLQKRGHLAKVWLAAHYEKKLTKKDIVTTNITKSIEDIVNDALPKGLRLHSQLLIGTVRIYSRQAKYLLDECNEAKMSLQMAFRPGAAYVDLPVDQSSAAFHQITLPDTVNEQDLLFQPMASTALLQSTLLPSIKTSTTTSAGPARPQDITLDEPGFLSPEKARDAFRGFTDDDPLNVPFSTGLNLDLDLGLDLDLDLDPSLTMDLSKPGAKVPSYDSIEVARRQDPFALATAPPLGATAHASFLHDVAPLQGDVLDPFLVSASPLPFDAAGAPKPSLMDPATASMLSPTLLRFPVPASSKLRGGTSKPKRPFSLLDEVTEISSDQFSKQLRHASNLSQSSSSMSLVVVHGHPVSRKSFLEDVCDTLKEWYPATLASVQQPHGKEQLTGRSALVAGKRTGDGQVPFLPSPFELDEEADTLHTPFPPFFHTADDEMDLHRQQHQQGEEREAEAKETNEEDGEEEEEEEEEEMKHTRGVYEQPETSHPPPSWYVARASGTSFSFKSLVTSHRTPVCSTSLLFYEVLLAKTRGWIQVDQPAPYSDIQITILSSETTGTTLTGLA